MISSFKRPSAGYKGYKKKIQLKRRQILYVAVRHLKVTMKISIRNTICSS